MIACGDSGQLSSGPKSCKKLAEKIIIELKNSGKSEKMLPEYREVFEALVTLGYNKNQARVAATQSKGKKCFR